MLKPSTLTLVFLTSFGTVSLRAESTATTREFRPLMAKKVAVEPAARVSHVVKGDAVQSQAWAYFDSGEWDKAIDKFLTALENNPASKPAAEGLAMSLYRSGDYASAYRLGSELSEVMPEIRMVVSEAVTAEVRFMVKEGEFETAKKFLSHFPSSDAHYVKAHALLADATTIVGNLGPDDDAVLAPKVAGVAKG